MPIKILRNKIFLSVLFLIALIAVLSIGYLSLYTPEANQVGDVMYLIPTDETKIEDSVSPERLLANQQNLTLGVTSNWDHVSQLASEGRAKAVIIHYAAIEQVNQQDLQRLFNNKQFVVVGIGIPGDKLASMVGRSDFYDKKMGVDDTAAYYFAFSHHPEQDWTRSTNGLLEVEDDVGTMLQTIENHLLTKVID